MDIAVADIAAIEHTTAKFTIASYCGEHNCTGYFARCCHDDEFMQTDSANHHVWLNMPEEYIADHLEHYLQCKATAPHCTSACVLVPARFRTSYKRRLLKGMQLIMQRSISGVDYHVYYDGPTPQLYAANANRSDTDRSDTGMLMSFHCTASGTPASLLVDTGASHAYVSTAFVQRCGFSVEPSTADITLADGTVATCSGTCCVRLRLGRYNDFVKFYVADLSCQWDLILGQSWLKPHCAVIDYSSDSISFWKAQRQYKLKSSTVTRTANVPLQSLFLSVAQVKRAIKGGNRTFLVHVTTARDPDVTPGTPIDPGIQSVLDDFPDRFPAGRFPEWDSLPQDRGIGHVIPLQDPTSEPPFRPTYRLSPLERQEAETQIKALLAAGLIEPSSSPYGAPILFADKKDGGLRMCIDYRALNKLTIKNRYPLPRIDDLLDAAQGAKIFSSLDLLSGYHQIRIQPEDCPKTAFRTPLGLYQWKVLSFGLTNAPATFQTVMNNVLRPVIGKFVLVYLDDILIFSQNMAEHIEHLKVVLQLLRDNHLYAKMSKCTFARSELEFLGHILSKDGLRVDPRKTSAVADWPIPQDISQVRSFLGMANYFRKFIYHFAQRTLPLTRMLRKESIVNWQWTSECQKAFEDIKHALTTAPVLALPDESLPYDVVCDASGFGLGAVLLQDGKPIAYESRQQTAAEQNYHITEQELLACIHALKTWRCYLEGAPEFRLHTDHGANTFLETQHKLSRRQVRWQEFLSRFHFRWEFVPGASNVADPLSRMPSRFVIGSCTQHLGVMTRGAHRPALPPPPPLPRPTPLQDDIIPASDQGLVNGGAVPAVDAAPSDMPSSIALPTVVSWREQLIDSYRHDPVFHDESNLDKLTLDEGLYHNVDGKVVVPDAPPLRRKIMSALHDSPFAGHVGINKTKRLVSRYYWWPSMDADVTQYVQQCHSCQTVKARQQKPSGALIPLELPMVPWECITLDFITQLPVSSKGFDAIMVVVDKLTKMVHIIPTTTTCTALQVAELYRDHVFRLHGVPLKVVSDRDLRFTSAFITGLCSLVGARQAMSTPYHPQTDGQTERVNRVLEDMLRHYVSPVQDDWDQHLACAEFAINNADHRSTGASPFMLNYGYCPRMPFSIEVKSKSPAANDFVESMQRRITEARTLHRIATQRQKHYADKGRKDVQFQRDQWVLLSSKNLRFKMGTPKLLPRFVGPFQVHREVGKNAYELVLPENWKIHDTFHVSQLAEYHTSGSYQPPPPVELLEGEIEYEVETVMDHRVQHKVVKSRPSFDYLVRWRGFGSDHDTWEPERNLKNASQVVQTYWDQCKAKGLEVPWSKPKFTSAVEVAQRRGRVARAPAHIAVSSAGKTGPTVSQKRRTRRHSRAARAHVTRPMD